MRQLVFAVIVLSAPLFAANPAPNHGRVRAKTPKTARAQVSDPAGNTLWDQDQISEWAAYRSAGHPAEGLWRITFSRASGYPFEDFTVLQQGAAPDFFLTPAKCW